MSHLLMRRSAHRQALAVANEALEYSAEDTLARYLQIALQRLLGELVSASDLERAESQLADLAGSLPSAAFEADRAQLHSDLLRWRKASMDGFSCCLQHSDVAQGMLCLFGKLVFP
jgi:hypothetical protein